MAERIVYYPNRGYAAFRDLATGEKWYRPLVHGQVVNMKCATAEVAVAVHKTLLLKMLETVEEKEKEEQSGDEEA